MLGGWVVSVLGVAKSAQPRSASASDTHQGLGRLSCQARFLGGFKLNSRSSTIFLTSFRCLHKQAKVVLSKLVKPPRYSKLRIPKEGAIMASKAPPAKSAAATKNTQGNANQT